ncbi:methylamine utilization protein [Aquabacterium sp.]|uniref:methylamine utilization protein n=1 Tax=Aquabacterium sp. TaxID=1872578 RepID=UPI002E348B7A|nr:methylamine utilization protein [Aquabacterium sp.]HEX5310698.1 methylamine utilization protein [Aquabacterium sp.]
MTLLSLRRNRLRPAPPTAMVLSTCLVLSAHAAPVPVTVLDSAGKPLVGAAVAVFVKGTPAATTGITVDMAQRDKQFVPSLVVIQTGSAVQFPNFDTIRHHVYSFSAIKPFEIKLYSGRPSTPVVFDRPGTATLGCNIHDGMVGYIHVVDTPYFGVTNAQGKVELELPSGDHRVRVWHPQMGEAQPGQEFRQIMGSTPVTLRLHP